MYARAIAYNYQLYRKEFISFIIAAGGVLMLLWSLIVAPAAGALSIGGPSDCDSNAIIRCGAHSTGALMNAYNSSAYVRGVYAAFGISQADMANLPNTNVAGRVTKNGEVFVDGQSKPVATGAMTGGRQNIAGSSRVNAGGAVFFKRPPSVSFQQASLPAFVAMQNGRFQFAVIASCGNAVVAQAIVAPQHQQHVAVSQARVVSRPPKPQRPVAPSVTQTQSQSQSQSVSVSNTNINNQTVTKSSPQPRPQPTTPATTIPTQPAVQASSKTLPNTGPTGAVGTFLAAVGLGTLAYRRLLLKRLG